jgi:hypothetical protein
MNVGERMLERYAGERIEVFELMRWYRERLEENSVVGLPTGWWGYGQYADGRPITKEHRLFYRARLDLRERFPNPFAVGEGTFFEMLNKQFPTPTHVLPSSC